MNKALIVDKANASLSPAPPKNLIALWFAIAVPVLSRDIQA